MKTRKSSSMLFAVTVICAWPAARLHAADGSFPTLSSAWTALSFLDGQRVSAPKPVPAKLSPDEAAVRQILDRADQLRVMILATLLPERDHYVSENFPRPDNVGEHYKDYVSYGNYYNTGWRVRGQQAYGGGHAPIKTEAAAKIILERLWSLKGNITMEKSGQLQMDSFHLTEYRELFREYYLTLVEVPASSRKSEEFKWLADWGRKTIIVWRNDITVYKLEKVLTNEQYGKLVGKLPESLSKIRIPTFR